MIKVTPEYTGGGIYVFLGEIDGKGFIADDTCFDVRILDIDPTKCDEDVVFDPKWQESHLLRDLQEPETRSFFMNMLKWVINNNPDGNYQMNDMIKIMNRLRG